MSLANQWLERISIPDWALLPIVALLLAAALLLVLWPKKRKACSIYSLGSISGYEGTKNETFFGSYKETAGCTVFDNLV